TRPPAMKRLRLQRQALLIYNALSLVVFFPVQDPIQWLDVAVDAMPICLNCRQVMLFHGNMLTSSVNGEAFAFAIFAVQTVPLWTAMCCVLERLCCSAIRATSALAKRDRC